MACLHGLYQRLTAARVLLPQQDKPPSYFSWNDLAEMVYEQVVSLVESLHQAEEKVPFQSCAQWIIEIVTFL